MDFVHCGAGVCHGSHFVGIVFFPPVKGGVYVGADEDHAQEFAVVAAGAAQLHGQGEVFFAEDILSVFPIGAVA